MSPPARTRHRKPWPAGMILLGVAAVLALTGPAVLAAIQATTTSTPTVTVRDPEIKVESGRVAGCSVTLNANETGATANATGTSGGSTYSQCLRLNNVGDTEYQFKVRYVSGTNLARLTTFKIGTNDNPIDIDHVIIDAGTVTQSESPSWTKISHAGKKPLDVHQKVTSGATSTVNLEALVAKGTQTRIYALYDITVHISAT